MMSGRHLLGCLLIALSSAALGQVVIELQTKTGTEDGAALNSGEISIDLFNSNLDTCHIKEMDADGNNYRPGTIDSFSGSELQECDGFPAPGNEIPLLQVTHKGLDGWQPEWFRILFDSGAYVECPANFFLDNDESRVIECDPPVMIKDDDFMRHLH